MNFEKCEADVDLILGKHYTPGRNGQKVQYVVVHYNAGNLTVEGCYSVWQTREASAHYQVESNGRVGQLVWDRDTAWHCGNKNVDPLSNSKSIGVEHANMADGTITETCLDTGAHLVAALCVHFGLGRPEWLKNVFPHKHFAATACPGQIYGIQKDAYIQRAQHWYDVMTGAVQPEPEEPATPLPDALRGYVDLDPDAWYVGAVEECVLQGYMSGYDASHFGPYDPLTRAQAVCVVSNAERADLSSYLEPFKDVAPEPFYYTALCWAVDNGVVSALDTFRPDDAATRAEFACMLHNWVGSPAPAGEPTGYPDWGEVPTFAREAMAWAVERGVISGSSGRLLPNSPCSRAEAAGMLVNLLD